MSGYTSKAAIYTWHGCTLQLVGESISEYCAGDTPMSSFLNVHLALEQMRVSFSQIQDQLGPRVSQSVFKHKLLIQGNRS